MIRWVVFDAVGTLIEPVPSVSSVYHAVGRRHGSRLSQEEVAARFRAAFFESEADTDGGRAASDRYRTSESLERDRWRNVVAAVFDDVTKPGDCFEELWRHFGRPEAWRCFDDVPGAFGELKEAGLRIAVASNFDSRLHAVVRGIAGLTGIEETVISSEVGHRKPSEGFYIELLQRLRLRPEEAVMVGDDWSNDVQGAREAGIRAIHLKRRRTGEAIASIASNAREVDGSIADDEIGDLSSLAARLQSGAS